MPELIPLQNVLRLRFSTTIGLGSLEALHRDGLNGDFPVELRDLLNAVGAEKLSGVYELSEDEIAKDTYGFAREFALSLGRGHDVNRAIDTLERSPLIQSVRPLLTRRSHS